MGYYILETAVLGLPIRETFDYVAGSEMKIGQRVIVDFAGRIETAVILNVRKVETKEEIEKIKPILGILDERNLIDVKDVALGRKVAESFLSPIGKVMELFFPPGMELKLKEMVIKKSEMAPGFEGNETAVEKSKYVARLGGGRRGNATLMKLLKLGVVDITVSYRLKTPKIKKEKVVYLNADIGEILKNMKPSRKRTVLEYLLMNDGVSVKKLRKDLNLKDSRVLKDLEKFGYIRMVDEDERMEGYFESFPKPLLTSSQRKVVDRILSSKNRKHLVYGVTGSGKTEIYFRVMEKFLHDGKNVLYLVPEISLTPQLLARVRDRFRGYEVGVYHSDLKKSERFGLWMDVVENRVRIIVGTRSSLWLPIRNLGLIIVDEEQDESYYQGDMEPIYDGVKVAEWKAELSDGVIVFGSATPRVSAFFLGKIGKYDLHEIHERVMGKLPKVEIVDLRVEEKYGSIFSKKLVDAMEKSLKIGGQIILFSNRKGFFPYVMCGNCGYIHRCRNCDVAMTYHFETRSLRCHYCGREESVPKSCPICGSREMVSRGFGTERVEREVLRIFPGVRVLRMDRDRIKNLSDLTTALELIKDQKVDVVVGTRMVTKGLDFPNISLVGVLNVDQLLNFPDYRASERIFELLAQVAGRSGRGRFEGTVILQTHNPDAFPIKFAVNHDYPSFYYREVKNREELNYPPFSELVRITVSHPQPEDAKRMAMDVKHSLLDEIGSEILGPVEALIFKLRGIYRYRILIKSMNLAKDLDGVRNVVNSMNLWKHIKVEVNPPV